MAEMQETKGIEVIDSKYLEECIFAIANGSLSSMNDLYTVTNNHIYSYSLSLLKNKEDAEDCTHDTYVAIFQSAPQYKPKGKPMAWMITIARNIAFQKINQRKRYSDQEITELQIESKPGRDPVDRFTLELVLNTLSQEEREIVILHALTGLKHIEIARITGLSLSGVLSKYNRAIKKMKAQYEKGELHES